MKCIYNNNKEKIMNLKVGTQNGLGSKKTFTVHIWSSPKNNKTIFKKIKRREYHHCTVRLAVWHYLQQGVMMKVKISTFWGIWNMKYWLNI